MMAQYPKRTKRRIRAPGSQRQFRAAGPSSKNPKSALLGSRLDKRARRSNEKSRALWSARGTRHRGCQIGVDINRLDIILRIRGDSTDCAAERDHFTEIEAGD